MTERLQTEIIQTKPETTEPNTVNPLFQVLLADAAHIVGGRSEEIVRQALDNLCAEMDARGGGIESLSEWLQQ